MKKYKIIYGTTPDAFEIIKADFFRFNLDCKMIFFYIIDENDNKKMIHAIHVNCLVITLE